MAKIEAGEDLRGYVSKGLTKLDYDDGLLNDWGIHHLHLGTVPDPNDSKFVARTGHVLFAVFEDERACLLGVHHHKPPPWARSELAQLLYDNWPKLLEPFRLNSVLPGPPTTETERKELRETGVVAPLVFDGKAYACPGGGYASSGTSIRAVRLMDKYRGIIRHVEETFHRELVTYVDANGLTVPAGATATWDMHLGEMYVWVPSIKLKMKMGPLEG